MVSAWPPRGTWYRGTLFEELQERPGGRKQHDAQEPIGA